MNLLEITAKVQVAESSATEQSVAQVLKNMSIEVSDIQDNHIAAIATEIQKSSTQLASTSTQLTEARSRTNTNSSVKKSAIAKKEGSAIATSKRGSSKVAKSAPVEKAQIETASTKALIQDLEVSTIEEAANAGYNADTGKLAAIAFVTGIQMRATDDIATMLPKAMSGIFGSIGEVSDTRYQGIFDHVRINEEPEAIAIDWSL